MVTIAILIGILGYTVFALGLLGLLYPWVLIVLIVSFGAYVVFTFTTKQIPRFPVFDKKEHALIIIICTQLLIAMIGVLGPEIGFDALWYHLTFPKLYLLHHSISHIPGGLFYYSDMPKLTEMLYTIALSVGDERVAKLIHFLFGVGILIILYRFSKKYMSRLNSLLTVLLFSSNLIVGWEMITSYVDLARTFFELFAFIFIVTWSEKKDIKSLFLSAVMLGLAISVKLLALSSLPIFLLIILYIGFQQGRSWPKNIKDSLRFGIIVCLIPLPWFLTSYLSTGNPFYPFFSNLYKIGEGYGSLSFVQLLKETFGIFTTSPDPISPLYLISLPFVLMTIKNRAAVTTLALIYTVFAVIIWYILPRVGGGRFLLPYLPVLSFLVMYSVSKVEKSSSFFPLRKVFIGMIIFYSLFFSGYRLAANSKYLPYITGKESKAEFLSKHLHFSYGDFYDTDGYFTKTITPHDTVLLYGFHNLYYVDFPFVDASYVKKGNRFNYIAVQNADLPERFRNWNLIYTNALTNVKVYSAGGITWTY